MLRISKLTDYAIVLATELAGHDGSSPTAVRDLARATGLPQPTVGKVLKLLAQRGLVASQRGAYGGYRLGRPAESITVADLVEALEGPIGVTECASRGGTTPCELHSSCGVLPNWQRINTAVLDALRGISLSEMVGRNVSPLVPLARSAAAAATGRVGTEHVSCRGVGR